MGILTLAAGASIYALLVVVASMGAGARGWGVHAAGFLPPGIRLLLLAALLAAAVLLWMTALQAQGTPAVPPPASKGRPERPRLWLLAPLLLPFGAALWFLRARTQPLADAVARPVGPPPHARGLTTLLRIYRELSACGRVPPALPVAGAPPGTRRGSRMGLRRRPSPRHLRASERDVSRSFLCRPGRARETAAPAEAPIARSPHRAPRPPALRAAVPARA